MTMRTVKRRCSVCEVDDAEWQFAAVDRLHGTPGTYQYVQCRRCATLYPDPCVAPEQLGALYGDDYAPHSAAPSIGGGSRQKPLRERMQDRLRYYLIFRALYALKGMRLDRKTYEKLGHDSRVLDVGCGSGSYLNMLRLETGAQVHGIDN